ncbi:MAG: DUF4433 domain-containing protein [Xanthobacteraceae bacterium]|nr:DUF4433 domain-containing protein [Xanthobacteraceae bacterium]
MPPPAHPKIYHIVHVDRLASIAADGELFCDAEIVKRKNSGTTIGMNGIKGRRLTLPIPSHPTLNVGECVPFYFCPRSIMLFLIHRANHPELTYQGGQRPIVHLEIDLHRAVQWANSCGRRWAYTLSNAGAYYFESRNDLADLEDLDWAAIHTDKWAGPGVSRSMKEGKQAEFLIEGSFPWDLVDRIGVIYQAAAQQVANSLLNANRRPQTVVMPSWYY